MTQPVTQPVTRPVPETTPSIGGTGTAVYVFAVCRSADASRLARLPGLDGSIGPVRALPFGELVAVVQDVPAADLSPEAWTQRLTDARELERCARAHHAVVTAAAADGPAVPMALAVLYNGDNRARAALSADADRFRAALGRIEGRVEWGVKVYAARPETPPGPPAKVDDPDGAAPSGAGRAYLERMRGLQRAREDGHAAALRAAREVHAALRELAVEARTLRLHEAQPTGDRRTQLLNAAYLVARTDGERIAAAVEALRHRTGTQIELSGPWVPYSFAGRG